MLKIFGFGKSFIKWIEIVLTNQESWIIIEGKRFKKFKLKRVEQDKEILYLLIISINVYPFIEVLKVFDRFSKLPGLKPNTSNC